MKTSNNVGYVQKQANMHLKILLMNFGIAHQNILCPLSWDFILQVSALETENTEHGCKLLLKYSIKTGKQYSFMKCGVWGRKTGF
jgi:hypothetical protein